jgi:hypothetical protein
LFDKTASSAFYLVTTNKEIPLKYSEQNPVFRKFGSTQPRINEPNLTSSFQWFYRRFLIFWPTRNHCGHLGCWTRSLDTKLEEDCPKSTASSAFYLVTTNKEIPLKYSEQKSCLPKIISQKLICWSFSLKIMCSTCIL